MVTPYSPSRSFSFTLPFSKQLSPSLKADFTPGKEITHELFVACRRISSGGGGVLTTLVGADLTETSVVERITLEVRRCTPRGLVEERTRTGDSADGEESPLALNVCRITVLWWSHWCG